MHRNYAQTCLAWEIGHTVYQGETFAVGAMHTKVIVLNTSNCFRFDTLPTDF